MVYFKFIMKLGDLELISVSDGTFLLDGGAMFGVVPKALWEKKATADEKNRITLGLNSLILKKGKTVIILETGLGEIPNKKLQEIYSLRRDKTLLDRIKENDFDLEDINYVINTHLHFDHCGWNTISKEGSLKPSFPKAKYIIQKKEWESALNPDERSSASYMKEKLLPLQEWGNLELIDGDFELEEGIKIMHIPGHTRGHQCVLIESRGKKLFFPGDLIPTSAHFPLPYIMAYDLFPLETLENKKRILQTAEKEDWIFALYHDPEHIFGKVEKFEGKWKFVPLEVRNEI
jgi:glyoxylase-like metal-dependent hydrolase (beta-lactamase superfamily II)